jgi:soluble lytic murein transglycosylase-like protein
LAELLESAPVKQKPAPPFHSQIIKASQTYNVEVALIKAVIMAESSYNPRAVSHRGAQGLMQLMPTTAKWLGVHDSFDPELNIDGGVRYLRRLLDRFDGDVRLALAAYNAGSRYVRKYGGVPPFKATRKYIKKVMQYRQTYLEELAVARMQQITS